MKKYDVIYGLPNGLRDGSLKKLEQWIIINYWNSDIKDNEFLGKRLAFLWDMREKNAKGYRDMASEKELIYRLDINDEIKRIAMKYSTT